MVSTHTHAATTTTVDAMDLPTTDRVEVSSDDLPHAAPLQPHSVHVVVADLYDLLQTEHAWVGGAT